MKNPTPFQPGWIGLSLNGYRPIPVNQQPATYGLFKFEDLPVLSHSPPDEFTWIDRLSFENDSDDSHHSAWQAKLKSQIPAIKRQAVDSAVSIPETFLNFIQDTERVRRIRIRSPTGCYFELSENLIAFETRGHEAQLLRFLSDSQDCWAGYLYLQPDDYCVITSWEWLEGELQKKRRPMSRIIKNSVFCATSFESFLYRFSFENELWYALTSGAKLSEEQRNYVEHYQCMHA